MAIEETRKPKRLAGELAEEFALVHVVLEGFAAVDKDDGNFVGELAAELFVGVDIDFLPAKKTSPLELHQALFDNLTKMTALASVNEDVASFGHWRSLAIFPPNFNACNVKKSKQRTGNGGRTGELLTSNT